MRYHGVLGPHYKHRKKIIPKPPELKVVDQDQETIIDSLAAEPPPLYPARGPPNAHHHFEDEYFQQHFEMSVDNFNRSAD